MANKKEIIKPSVILEKPINDIKEDKFNVYPYVEQLKEACEKGATFIAVDGKFGSGKSSIVKLFENEMRDDKNIFVNVNFMNINAIPEKETIDNITPQEEKKNEDIINVQNKERKEKLIVNDYHRYFVNQVINDICKDPYEFEKLFYNQRFSYATINLKTRTEKEKKYKYYIDRAILWLLGFISVYTLYESFFNKINFLQSTFNFITPIMPVVVLITFVLILVYGYGFYKPDKNIQSPMLDTDKCRNNFLKVIKDYLLEGTTLYLVIDDLDRIKSPDLQLQVISLLFNEYYPLNEIINNVKLKFIFMIDITKIKSNEELQPQKMFDYILPVSSNQKTILKHYTEMLIKENEELTKIFNIKNREYYIGLIISNFKGMRDIKHLLNKILTKGLYIKSKQIDINCGQLIVLSILTSLESDEAIAHNIECVLNKTDITPLNENALQIINDNVNSKVIDKNYYIYIYNFIDESNLLSNTEETIFDLLMNTEMLSSEKIIELYKNIESPNIRLNVLYDECYKYLNDNKRTIMLGNKKFYNYMKDKDLIDYNILNNLYLNTNAYNLYNNIKNDLNNNQKQQIIFSLIDKYENYTLEDDEKYDDLIKSFTKFIKNLKENIVDFDIVKDIINVIEITDEIYNLFVNTKINNHSIVYDLIVDDILPIISIKDKINEDFINEISNDNLLHFKLEEKILISSASNDIKKYIIINQEQTFNNITNVYESFNKDENFKLTNNELKIIMTRYNYDNLLDKYIITNLKDNTSQRGIIQLIKENEFDLSNNILNELNSLKTKYGYNEYYENLFKCRKYYKLLIYSQAINNNKFKLDTTISNDIQYKEAVVNIYQNMGNYFKNCCFTSGFINMVIKETDFSNISFNISNFWKIDILIPSLSSYDKCIKIFDRLKDENKIIDYATYYKNNDKLQNKKFLNYLQMYTEEMSPQIKGSITKAINAKNKLTNKIEV